MIEVDPLDGFGGCWSNAKKMGRGIVARGMEKRRRLENVPLPSILLSIPTCRASPPQDGQENFFWAVAFGI
jgi:hypothetical protein